MVALRPSKLTQNSVGKEQGIQASVSQVCQRIAVQIVQVFQGQSPVCPTQSEVWFSVRCTGTL